MAGSYRLDTNAAIALPTGDARLRVLLAGADVFLPAVAVGELYFGAYHSARVAANLLRVDGFVAASVLIAVDQETSRAYGRVKAALRAKGRPIPDKDMWIAATAVDYDFVLVTRDAHFAHVDGLKTQTW